MRRARASQTSRRRIRVRPEKSVQRRIVVGEAREFWIDLHEIGAHARTAAHDREPDRAHAGAGVHDASFGQIRRGREQGGVRTGAMAAPGLNEGQPPAEPGVPGQPVL